MVTTMVKKRAPKQLWDYGVSWLLAVMTITFSLENYTNGGITLTNVTSESADKSKYLEFGFYEKFWLK